MAVVLWCFVGIEASSVLSGRAKSQQTVRKATIISILTVLAIYMLVTFIAMTSVSASELATAETPIALVLQKTGIGAAGAAIVQIGIMISVLGASLSWMLLSVETLYAAAKDGVLPRYFAKINKKDTPINALLLTQIFTQIFLFAILFSALNDLYLAAITVGTTLVLIPYLLSSLYAVKISFSEKDENIFGKIIAILGTLYASYVIYTVGLKYLYLSIIFYAIGAFLFLKAKHEKNEKPKPWEWAFIVALVVGAATIIYLILRGTIQL